MIIMKKNCVVCGAEFETNRPAKKYCSKRCCSAAHNTKRREAEALKNHKFTPNMMEINRLTMLGHKVGLSYGKYVAKVGC